jgi:hypothetical protein
VGVRLPRIDADSYGLLRDVALRQFGLALPLEFSQLQPWTSFRNTGTPETTVASIEPLHASAMSRPAVAVDCLPLVAHTFLHNAKLDLQRAERLDRTGLAATVAKDKWGQG